MLFGTSALALPIQHFRDYELREMEGQLVQLRILFAQRSQFERVPRDVASVENVAPVDLLRAPRIGHISADRERVGVSMGLRFNRRIPLIPGLRVNLSKTGASLSLGHAGGWLTIGPRGTRATAGLPGSGLSYSTPIEGGPHLGHQAMFVLILIAVVYVVATNI